MRTGWNGTVAIALAASALVFAGCETDDESLGDAGTTDTAQDVAEDTTIDVGDCPATPETLSGAMGERTLGCPEYIVDGDLEVSGGTLTILPGVQLTFTSGSTLWISDDAAIHAEGTEDAPIRLLGATEAPAFWRAFVIESPDPTNVLRHVEIAHGGSEDYFSNNPAGLYLGASATVTMDHVTFRDNGGYGLSVEPDVKMPGFTSNTFSGNETANALISTRQVGMLDEASDYGAEGEYVEVYGRVASDDATWPATNVPLRFSGNHEFDAGTLTLSEGVDIEMTIGATLWIGTEAAIVANGTEEDPVTIRGATETAAFWRAFVIESPNPVNTLTHVVVAHGGSEDYFSNNPAGLYLGDGARVTLDHCTFRDNGGYGLSVETDVKMPGFTTNTFSGNEEASALVSTRQVGMLDDASDYGAEGEYVQVYGRVASGDNTWPATNRPLRFTGDHELEDGAFTLEPGLRIEFVSGATLWVSDDASFTAEGTAEAPIEFVGATEVAEFWRAFVIESPDPTNSMSHVRIAHGGSEEYFSNAPAGLYLGGSAHLSLTDSVLEDNGGVQLYVEDGATIDPADPTTANTIDGDVRLPGE
ncbi:MAG: right-handed parallel beta-helix repeat-containing protein [Myxococcota bacterium]